MQKAAAKTKEGLLGWSTIWNGSNISLNVNPGEAVMGAYQTKIIWTLNDIPINE
ncbi:WxL domain-containing protein [endosymbiont 'TC1' of Trimyema compressum]|uniref:WxL domain-containing protein n=1 Tax=endosymbiont 'TC1' of Trimyema compressum TaxID=243899 RepID=UPI0013923578|nr:WxL domain-containing protein [endosymbiont 'TC1' of Trimyema compressum]